MRRARWWCDEIDRTELGWWPTYLLWIGNERNTKLVLMKQSIHHKQSPERSGE